MHSNLHRCSSQPLLLFLFVTIILACICASSVRSTGGDDDKKYYISTIAGNGLANFLKVNVSALEAKFDAIYGIVQSKNGDLFASSLYHVVLKLSFNKAEGTWSNVEVIAGTGTMGNGDDDIAGTQSALNNPMGLSLIEDGSTGEVTDILIADYGNCRIRKLVMSTRIITTIAGNGTSGFSGDDLPAKDAQLKIPRHVHYDKSNGDIYIVDHANHRIRRVRNETITTVVGKTCNSSDGLGDGGQATDACLTYPSHFTINEAGAWLIADRDRNLIRKVYLNGTITTVAGGGTETGDAPATSVKLDKPQTIALTLSGNLLVAEYSGENPLIRKMDGNGFMKIFAGGSDQIPSSDNPIPAKTASISPLVIAYARDGSDDIFIGDNRGFIFMVSNRTKCYGVWSDNSSVCSGHGSCIGLDECECDDGWTGHDCSVAYCFDVMSNETSLVCSGHGSCIGTDQCECDNGWMQVDCSITHCFGFSSNLPDKVCSGRGKCVSPNKCHCSDEYRGHKCHKLPKK